MAVRRQVELAQGLRQSYNDLDGQRRDVLERIADLDAAQPAPSARTDADNLDLLDALPLLALKLDRAPQDLQARLYQVTQLNVHVHPETEEVDIMIRIPGSDIGPIGAVAEAIANTTAKVTGALVCTDAVRTPNQHYCEPEPARQRPGGVRGFRVHDHPTRRPGRGHGSHDGQVGGPVAAGQVPRVLTTADIACYAT